MGHSTLKALGVLPGTPGAQMATHTGIRPDDDAHVRGTAIGSSGCPLRRYLHALPSSVGLDGHAPAILAGSHDSPSVWGCFHQVSDLANTLIQDINVWMPHSMRFGWNYVATHASLWLNIWDQFAEEHLKEWETQKFRAVALNDLERDTEAVYRARIIKKQDNKACTDSKEAATQELPPE